MTKSDMLKVSQKRKRLIEGAACRWVGLSIKHNRECFCVCGDLWIWFSLHLVSCVCSFLSSFVDSTKLDILCDVGLVCICM